MVHSATDVIDLPGSVSSASLVSGRGGQLLHALVCCTAACLCFFSGDCSVIGVALQQVSLVFCSNCQSSLVLHIETLIAVGLTGILTLKPY